MQKQRYPFQNMPLRQSIEYCGRCNGANVFVWDGSKHPNGTVKDMRNRALLESIEGGEDRKELLFVQITYGNSGYSLGMMARQMESESESGFKRTVVNIIPKGKIPRTVRRSLGTCSIVHELELGKEIVPAERQRKIAREAAGFEGSEDNIIHVESYGLEKGFRRIIHEIAEKGIKPKYIFCPVGEGELAAELAYEAEALWGEGAPKVIGVTIQQNAILKKDDFVKKPGASIADKLVNGYSKFKPLVLNLVERGRMELLVASDAQIAHEYKYLASIGISSEPSAAAAFAGAVKYDLKPEDVIVIINTGKGIYDQKAVDKIWQARFMKAAKLVAAVAAGVILTLGVLNWKGHVERQNRRLEEQNHFLELQRRELAQMSERDSLSKSMAQAAMWLDKNGDAKVSDEEFEIVRRLLPDAPTERYKKDSFPYIFLLDGFTETQLRYFSEFSQRQLDYISRNRELDHSADRVGMMIISDMRRKYEEEIKLRKEPEPTVGVRLYNIYNSRSVKKYGSDGDPFCTFREFDPKNPFDASKEKLCDQ